MGIIFDPSNPAESLPNRGRQLGVSGPGANTLMVNGTPVTVGTEFAGGEVLEIAPDQVKVRMPSGEEKWVKLTGSGRLAPYISGDKLDLLAAVKAGITDPIDYAGWNVKADTIAAAKDVLVRQAAAEKLEPYKSGDSYNIYKAIEGGVDQQTLEAAFGIKADEYQQYKLVSPYLKVNGNEASLDLQKLLDDLNGTRSSGRSSVDLDVKDERVKEILTRFKGIKLSDADRARLNELLDNTIRKYQLSDDDKAKLQQYLSGLKLPAGDRSLSGLKLPAGDRSIPGTKNADEADELVKAFKDQFGIDVIRLKDNTYTIKSGSKPLETTRELPEGVTNDDIAALATRTTEAAQRLAEVKGNLEKARTELNEFRKWLQSQPNGYTTTPEETRRYDELQENYAAASEQYSALTKQMDSLDNMQKYIKAYQTGRVESFNLSREDLDKYLATVDPELTRYITGNGGFDLVGAMDAGVSEDQLKALGFTSDDFAQVAEYQRIKAAWEDVLKVLPDGITTNESIALALQAGLEDQLKVLGVEEGDIESARSWQLLIDKGYVNAAGEVDLTRAQKDGFDAQILSAGFTQEQLTQAVRFNQQAAKLSPFVGSDGLNLEDAVKAGLTKAEDYVGWNVTQEDIDKAIKFNDEHVRVADQYFLKADIEAMKKDSPELYDILTSKGIDAYNAEIARINAAYEKQMQTLKELEAYRTGPTDDDITIAMAKGKPLDIQYSLEDALKGGFDKAELIELFGKEAVDATVTRIAALEKLEKYKTGTDYDILSYATDNNVKDAVPVLLAAGFDTETVNNAIKESENIRLDYEPYVVSEVARKTGLTSKEVEEFIQMEMRYAGFVPPDSGEYKMPERAPEEIREAIAAATKSAHKSYISKQGMGDYLGSQLAEPASFSVQPLRAIAPSVKVSDITAEEWIVGAGQAALWASGPVGGRAGGWLVRGGSALLIGKSIKDFPSMTAGQRAASVAVDVLMLLPVLSGVAKGVKFATVKVPTLDLPTTAGGKTVWRGLSILDRPVIGKSAGKFKIGKGGIELPAVADIEAGFKPVTKLETNIITNRKALLKMGVSEEQIKRLEITLQTRKMFVGKKSKFTDPEVLTEPIKTLNKESVRVVFEQAVKSGKKVERVYGSTTTKAQLAPELRKWRTPNDIDVQIAGTADEAAAWAKKLVVKLQKTQGVKNVRISKTSPTLIEVKGADGKWHHAVDIHSKDEALASTLLSKSDDLGTGSYGMWDAEKALTVKYPGLGKLNVMRLSEAGKRKVKTILEIREGKFAPPEHRLKDIADYYVILRTFKGKDIADKWAKIYGYTPDELLKAAQTGPLATNQGWEFIPSGTKGASAGATPTIQITIPPSMAVASKAYQELLAEIESPVSVSSPAAQQSVSAMVSPSSGSASSQASAPASAGASMPASMALSSPAPASAPASTSASVSPRSPSLSPKTSPSLPSPRPQSLSPKAPSPTSSTAVPRPVSLSARISPSAKAPSGSLAATSRSTRVAGRSSVSASSPASRAPQPRYFRSVSPDVKSPGARSPYTYSPKTTQKPKPTPPPRLTPPPYYPNEKDKKKNRVDFDADGKKRKRGKGKFAWRQGMLKVGGVLKPVWITVTPTKGGITKKYTLKPPDDAQILKRTPKQTAYAKGKEYLPKSALVGMGAFDVKILPDGTPKLKFRRSRA